MNIFYFLNGNTVNITFTKEVIILVIIILIMFA